jgi:hypothetical protein
MSDAVGENGVITWTATFLMTLFCFSLPIAARLSAVVAPYGV